MVSANKNINQNFRFDILKEKLHKYSKENELNFLVSSKCISK